MTKKSDKPAKKPARVVPPSGVRIVNGGRLNSGGSWPNSGRPPSELRALAREELSRQELIPHLGTLGKTAQREGDQINAILALARIGMPSQVDVGENPDNPILTPEEREARLKAWLDRRGT